MIVKAVTAAAVVCLLALALLGAYRDRRRVLRLADDQKRLYMSLFENSMDMVVCYDPENNRIVRANPVVCRMTGCSPDVLEPDKLSLLFASDAEMAAVREEYRHAAEENRSRQVETAMMDKDGRQLRIQATVFPIDVGGKRYIYAIGRDVTAQKQAEEKLRLAKEEAENANRIKGEFLAILSHEIRTPLNGMIGINQLLLETELTDKQREMLLVQEKSGQVLMRVINEVLDFSKIEAGTVELADELFHLPECLKETAGLFTIAARDKGIELNYRPAGPLPEYVYGDVLRLRQILVNLIGNAVKFTESGYVLLETEVIGGPNERDEAWVEFRVTDSGIGIDPSKVHLLFLPFSQLHGASKGRSDQGTGLGLAICKDLVELMGGNIWVEAGRKKGASFGFRIPLKLMQEQRLNA